MELWMGFHYILNPLVCFSHGRSRTHTSHGNARKYTDTHERKHAHTHAYTHTCTHTHTHTRARTHARTILHKLQIPESGYILAVADLQKPHYAVQIVHQLAFRIWWNCTFGAILSNSNLRWTSYKSSHFTSFISIVLIAWTA